MAPEGCDEKTPSLLNSLDNKKNSKEERASMPAGAPALPINTCEQQRPCCVGNLQEVGEVVVLRTIPTIMIKLRYGNHIKNTCFRT